MIFYIFALSIFASFSCEASIKVESLRWETAYSKPHCLVAMSFNIDTNIGRLYMKNSRAGPTHPDWRVMERMPPIKNTLSSSVEAYNPDIITVQEGRAFEMNGVIVDSVTPVVQHLEDLGYTVVSQPYNPTEFAFCYVTAFKNSRFELESQRPCYITKTPDQPTNRPDTSGLSLDEIKEIDQQIKKDNYGEYWERCLSLTQVKDKQDESFLLIVNTHLGFSENLRLKASEILSTIAQETLDLDSSARIIVQGDFNTFPEWIGPEQIEKIREKGVLSHASENLLLPNGNLVGFSFIAFPYDFAADEKRLAEKANGLLDMPTNERREEIHKIFKNDCKALGGHLDQVFYAGFTSGQSYIVPAFLFEEPSDYTEEIIKNYILDHLDDGPAFASDHQPIVTIFH